MPTIGPLTRGFARGIFAGVIGCLFFLHSLAFVVSPNARGLFSTSVQDASVSTVRDLCGVAMHDGDAGDEAPGPDHRQHSHCALCVASARELPLPAVVPITAVVVVAAPPSDKAPRRFIRDELAPRPPGWTSSWSSRAPPPIA